MSATGLCNTSLAGQPRRIQHTGQVSRHSRCNKLQARVNAPSKPEAAPPTVDAEAFKRKVIEEEAKYIVQTYARPTDVVFTHGEGCRMYDATGKSYLDFAAGIAVNVLGHSHPVWQDVVAQQAATLAHTSNLFHTVPQVELAKRLVENSFADKAFFCNSGTEANEGAIKFARKWARVNAGVDPYDPNADAPYEIVSFSSCFHGRTLGALTLTYKEQYKAPFRPLIGGAKEAKFLDLESAAACIQKGKTAAVFVEPVQGEGGVNLSTLEFLRGLRRLCDDAGALLVYDEVQCGLGRTGKLWGHELYGITPDIMTLAKPLAGGLPIGAVLMKQHVADAMQPGDHGSTFAGNPLVCAAACAVFDIVADAGFLAGVEEKGERLRAGLQERLKGSKHVKEVRGAGLIVGVQLDVPAGPITTAARERGLIVITAGKGDVVRLVPPLTVSNDEIDECCDILSGVISELP